MMGGRATWGMVLALAVAAGGCAGGQLDLRARDLRVQLEAARANGAYRCAPGNALLDTCLSQARADPVKAYLVGHGVEAGRLEARGFGPDQPIETNKTSAGREKNRRVDFVITQQ